MLDCCFFMNTAQNTLFVVVKHSQSLGASEDLVFAAAERLISEGKKSAFWFNFRPPRSDARMQRLRAVGCPIYYPEHDRLSKRIRRRFQKSAARRTVENSLAKALRHEQPKSVILNQGGNSDAWIEAAFLKRTATPYAVICHAATESSWPSPEFLPAMRTIFTSAAHCFFVSKWVQDLTEAQIGMLVDLASIVYNPCKFSAIQPTGWPESSSTFSLAAVSRIENKQKGHDLILQTLARPEWRKRPLTVTFYGDGPHRESLISYAESLKLHSVSFPGHVADIKDIWSQHHGFIQASRFEGYGLSLLEAMFCGRMAIATPFPSAIEFIEEGVSGFLARGASVDEVADVLDRAWTQRERWQEMGKAAAGIVDKSYPKNPVSDFLKLLNKSTECEAPKHI
jgi:glycosyltransferase involved in cell wall biosynthesis